MEKNRRLWPYSARAAVILLPALLLAQLLTVAILRRLSGWPAAGVDRVVLIGIAAISVLPVLLALMDTIVEGRAVVEYAGVKLDFSRVSVRAPSSVTVPHNIGVPGQPISDSDTAQILDTLRQATNTDVVVVDLENGDAWWETRLLVLVAGAVRLGQPSAIVFVATQNDQKGCFQGWAPPRRLIAAMLKADRRYRESAARAAAAAGQWALAEPAGAPAAAAPPFPPQGLAQMHGWMAFEHTGLPNELAPEQFLAADLGARIELESPRSISAIRLQEIFFPVLRTRSVEETSPARQQVEAFLSAEDEYIPVTSNGRYLRLVPRLTGIAAILSSIVEQKTGE